MYCVYLRHRLLDPYRWSFSYRSDVRRFRQARYRSRNWRLRAFTAVIHSVRCRGSTNRARKSFQMDFVGPYEQLPMNPTPSSRITLSMVLQIMISNILYCFWAQEEISSAKAVRLSADKEQCEQHFLTTYTRNTSGCYVVRLSFRLQSAALGSSYFIALRMLHKLQRRFVSDIAFSHFHTNFLKEYEDLGYISRFQLSLCLNSRIFYLTTAFSRKAVRQPSSTSSSTARARRPPTCPSTILYISPKQQRDIFDILLHWRVYQYVQRWHR